MLRIKTKEAASWLIGAVAGVCVLVVTLASLPLNTLWWVVVVATVATFVGVSLAALLVIKKYVAYKLKPIYSTVFSRDVHTAEMLDELKDKRVENISQELSSWADENDKEIARLKAQDAAENAHKIKQLELQKQQLAEEKRQFDAKMAEEKRQYDQTLALQKSKAASSGGGSSSSKKSSSSGSSIKKSSGSSGSSSVNKSRTSKGDNSEKVKSNAQKTIDMNSVLALGYGPNSASRLNQLVSQGLVEQYTSGNKIKFRKSAYTNKQASLFR